MILDFSAPPSESNITAEVAVVGAGPAGIVTALEAAGRGLNVVLVESGRIGFDPLMQDLSEAAAWDRERHAPMSLATRRQLGGTSVIWGGRCVPYDPVDFASRPHVGAAAWPIGYEEVAGYFQRACDWLVCGRAVFSALQIPGLPPAIVPGLIDGDVTSSTLERWSLPTNFGAVYFPRLRDEPRLRVLTGLTCSEIVCPENSGRADRLLCRAWNGTRVGVTARAFVIACGGLEGTRLLLASRGPQGGALGNHSDQLGRWYMSHVEGTIARVRFSTPPRATVFGYERDLDGVYVRRRLTFTGRYQMEQALPNVVSYLGNPELPDARHRSGPLSFAYLALRSPLGARLAPDAQRLALTGQQTAGTPYGGLGESSPALAHVGNMVRQPVRTAGFVAGFGTRRFLARGRRAPGFFIYNPENVYPLQYHGEHLPQRESRVTLSRERDSLGRPRLSIDLRYSDRDISGVLQAHRLWDEHLQRCGVGRLEYLYPDPGAAVLAQAGGGFHQCGTTRMSAAPEDGVVDGNLAVHLAANVHVASSSTFVTSGQANSTFMVVVLAVRLGEHLGRTLRP